MIYDMNNFKNITDEESLNINGGDFWRGLGTLATAIATGVGIGAVIVAAPVSVTVAAVATVSIIGCQFAGAVGIADMAGAVKK